MCQKRVPMAGRKRRSSGNWPRRRVVGLLAVLRSQSTQAAGRSSPTGGGDSRCSRLRASVKVTSKRNGYEGSGFETPKIARSKLGTRSGSQARRRQLQHVDQRERNGAKSSRAGATRDLQHVQAQMRIRSSRADRAQDVGNEDFPDRTDAQQKIQSRITREIDFSEWGRTYIHGTGDREGDQTFRQISLSLETSQKCDTDGKPEPSR